MSEKSDFRIRPARPGDGEDLVRLIGELAVYERLAGEAKATPEQLERALFDEPNYAEALIAECDGEAAGFALFFHNFSTFTGRPGLYLEDLYVREPLRGRGIGKALLMHLVGLAVERGCARMEWSVLDWNTPAIEFYQGLGARAMSDWTVFRLDEVALARLAG